ncbi:ATP-binding cassette domain-containing protein [Streptomyces sp. NPDC057565]|uniref:ATP-binding cassette domain-containing protein n=1 Tax=Streptomyces sp. NPDC057565 TaxID=3346169 RepID=UPI0036A5EDE4
MVAVFSQPLLSLHGISKRFGAVQALDNIELDIRAGEVVALVGNTGAGKSTLVKVIAGVAPADEGIVRWEGRTVQLRRPNHARTLGITAVYQDLALCDHLDVVENLYLGCEIRRFGLLDEVEMDRRTRDLLGTLSISLPDPRVPAAALSRAQRQTVAICRSLLSEPRLLLLDEPTVALNFEQSTQVLDLVERLRDRGVGILLISHNMGDVKAVADRVAILRLGRNNGFFYVNAVSHEQIISSVTGATDNAVAHRTELSEEEL